MKIINRMFAVTIIAVTIMLFSSVAPEDKKSRASDMYCMTTADFKPICLHDEPDGDFLFAKELPVICVASHLPHMLCVISEEAERQLQSHTQYPIRKDKYWFYRC